MAIQTFQSTPGSARDPVCCIRQKPHHSMNKLLVPIVVGLSALTLLAGCSWQVGGGHKTQTVAPTTGQQLLDLQRAKDSGAITDSEYQAQKARVLGGK
jgi:Short C-terminal domain